MTYSQAVLSPLKRSYLALVLEPSATAKLLAKFSLVHPRQYAHHVTLNFNPMVEDLDQWGLDTQISAVVVSVGADDKAQAVRVHLRDSSGDVQGKRIDGKHLHVTLSVAAGASPADSNKIADDRFADVRALIVLPGTVRLLQK